MIRPTTALPTGPFDLHSEEFPTRIFDARLTALRSLMRDVQVTHAVIHGSMFDHEALSHYTYFTPKLGPAYALVPAAGPLRLLFSGGPGMKPSAVRLTWIADVVALRGIETDMKHWLQHSTTGAVTTIGLIEGSAMSRRDWRSVVRAAGGVVVELDGRKAGTTTDATSPTQTAKTRELCNRLVETFADSCKIGDDIRSASLNMVRMSYREGAEDVRILAGRRPDGPPTRLPDTPLPLIGPTPMELSLRHKGTWHTIAFTLTPQA